MGALQSGLFAFFTLADILCTLHCFSKSLTIIAARAGDFWTITVIQAVPSCIKRSQDLYDSTNLLNFATLLRLLQRIRMVMPMQPEKTQFFWCWICS